jgi:Restriction endonuclease BglII
LTAEMTMGLDLIPEPLHQRYLFAERGHASAILFQDFPSEFSDILDCLLAFRLRKSIILARGGGRSAIPITIDTFLHKRGWYDHSFTIDIKIEGESIAIPTHHLDNFKNRVGLEVEWNSKNTFYDRDLNNFRLLRDLRVLSVGVIVTRTTELQLIFDMFGKGQAYGPSSTHWDSLIRKVDAGSAGGCPLLLIGIKRENYDPSL